MSDLTTRLRGLMQRIRAILSRVPQGAAEPSARCDVCGLVPVAERGEVCRTCAEDGPAEPWTDPDPWKYRNGSVRMAHVEPSSDGFHTMFEHLPRTKEQYDAEEGNR